jgi:hypothetical protein
VIPLAAPYGCGRLQAHCFLYVAVIRVDWPRPSMIRSGRSMSSLHHFGCYIQHLRFLEWGLQSWEWTEELYLYTS